MARVFSLKSTPLNIWIMMVYIVWVKTWCIKYNKIEKKKMFHRYLEERHYPYENQLSSVVMILRIPIICYAHGFTSQEVFLRATRENSFDFQYCLESSHSLSHTTHAMKSHINIGYIRLNKITIKFGT